MAGERSEQGLIERSVALIADVERSGCTDAAYARDSGVSRSAISEARRLAQLAPLCGRIGQLSRSDARDLVAELTAIAQAAGVTVGRLAEQIADSVPVSSSVDDIIKVASAHGHPAQENPELSVALVDACRTFDVQIDYQSGRSPVPSLSPANRPAKSEVLRWSTVCLARYLSRIRRVELDELALAALGSHSRRYDSLHDLIGTVARTHGISPVTAHQSLQSALCSPLTEPAARAALIRLISVAAEGRAV